MKIYIKDGVIKQRNEIVIYTETSQIINPPEDMILSNGWAEYVYTPEVIELTYEQKLENAKRTMCDMINRHDSSDSVNSFYMNGDEIWLDKSTRVGLMLRLQSEQSLDMTTTTLWYNQKCYELPIEHAINMLYALEVYASKCYDTTQRHLANVMAMTTIEEVEHYDYFENYPNKLMF